MNSADVDKKWAELTFLEPEQAIEAHPRGTQNASCRVQLSPPTLLPYVATNVALPAFFSGKSRWAANKAQEVKREKNTSEPL
jgi:hypothetical protein